MNVIFAVLFTILGILAGGLAAVPGMLLIGSVYKPINAIGRRWGAALDKRIGIATTAITVLWLLMVAASWFAVGAIGHRQGWDHTLALQVGATAGALFMGGMCWIFIGASLDQAMRDRSEQRLRRKDDAESNRTPEA